MAVAFVKTAFYLPLTFNPDNQISEDAIDLRLHPKMKRLKSSLEKLDIIEDKLEDCLEDVIIPKGGYVLEPGGVLFGETLEIINITSPKHIGLVVGRPKIASYGISVEFDQIKVPVDLAWHFPLCIKNNTKIPIIIPAFMRVVQLMLVLYPFGHPYKGKGDYRYQKYPGIDIEEMNCMTSDYKTLKDKICRGKAVKDYEFDKNGKNVMDIINKEKLETSTISKLVAKIPNLYIFVDAIRTIMLLGFVWVISNSSIASWIKWGYSIVLILLLIIEQVRKKHEQ